MHKQQGWLQAWEYCQAKLIQTLGELHKEWTEAGVSASRVTTLRRLQEKGYQATSEPETTSEASYLGCGEKELDCCSVVQSPLSDESKFWISFGNQGPRVWRKSGEAQNPCCLKSSVVSTVSDDLGCHVICWCWSTVFSEVHSQRSHLPGNFRALPCFLLLTSFMEMLISFYSRTWHLPTLPKVPKVGSMTMCYCAWLASKLAWPEPHRESMGYCQEEDETPDPTMQMSWRPLSKKPGLPYHLSSATNWSPPRHANWGSN